MQKRIQFMAEVEKLAAGAPIVRYSTDSNGESTSFYFKLEPIGECPWVTVTDKDGGLSASVSGGSEVYLDAQSTADAFLHDCRIRLQEANVEPAF